MKILCIQKIKPSICDCCGSLIGQVDVVELLPAGRGEPQERGWRCPICGGLDSFTEIEDEDNRQLRLLARSQTRADGTKTATAEEITRRVGAQKVTR